MKTSKSLFLGLALLLATSAFAANKGSLTVQEPMTVNGTQLKPGDYKVQWDGNALSGTDYRKLPKNYGIRTGVDVIVMPPK